MQTQKSTLYPHILSSMQERSTEELLEIWQTNDRETWSDETFDAIREILQQRLGQVPEQGAALDAESVEEDGEEEAATVVETYHSPTKLIRLAGWANTLSWVVLVIYGLLFLNSTNNWFSNLRGADSATRITFILSMVIVSLGTLATGFFLFLMLQIAAEITYTLLDIYDEVRMEENSVEEA